MIILRNLPWKMQDFFGTLDALHASMVLMLYSTQILMNEIISFETFRLFVVQREMESCEKQAKKRGKKPGYILL